MSSFLRAALSGRRPLFIFVLSLIFFIERGSYRAIRYSTTGDFSTLYGAARTWLHGGNPYDRATLKTELAEAGAPQGIQHDQNINPSVYLPAAMPWMALLSWLPWRAANTAWSLLSLALFFLSLWEILASTSLAYATKWLAASAALLFSPTYVGIYDGNASVVVVSLTALTICLARQQATVTSGLLLGAALCFKPQIAVCALCVLALWRRWTPLLLGVLVLGVATMAGVLIASHFGHNWDWWQSEQQNVAASFQPGGQSDPLPGSRVAWQLLNAQTLTSYLFADRIALNIATWIVAMVLVAIFLKNRTSTARMPRWRDAGFFSALTLVVTYHRYYDAQILLLLIPSLAAFLQEGKRLRFGAIALCLLVLAFPVQSVFARQLGARAEAPSLIQAVLLRNQPFALLVLTAILALCGDPPFKRGSGRR